MTSPARVTKAEFEAAVAVAKAHGARRVIFDGGRIVIELSGGDGPESVDGPGARSHADDVKAWNDAA